MDYLKINYLEASENYTIFHFQSGEKSLHSYTLKHFEELFSVHQAFSRIHRKYLVNRNFIISHSEYEVLLQCGKRLPIARRRSLVNKTE